MTMSRKRANEAMNGCDHIESNKKTKNEFRDAFEEWTADDVCRHLRENDLDEVAVTFKKEDISGSVLGELTESHLEKLGISKLGQRLQILQIIRKLQEQRALFDPHLLKVFNDPIHGHIELHPLCIAVMDTPQFQRLRYLKQLGGTYYVFPGASNNRFEHCIGVCYLAGQLGRTLQKKQPELQITDVDLLCVELAGLCHDLGHGPFSHMFDGKFIPAVRPNYKWKHEDASVNMFDHLLESNCLRGEFSKYGLSDRDIVFIKEQIRGPKCSSQSEERKYEGRSKEKYFLYEIVANKRNGIDVDKWDYFARDCHNLGIKNNFDHTRFMKFVRVINVDGEMQICARDKEVGNIYDMFHTRNTLHRRAYQHKVANIIETMITEALIKANDFITFPGKNGAVRKISETIDDMEAYTHLTDDIFHQILRSTAPELTEARNILKKIQRRQLYKCVGQTTPKSDVKIKTEDINEIKSEILSMASEDTDEPLTEQDFVFHIIDLSYGMKDKNPIDHVRFYSKSQPDVAIRVRKDQVSRMLPETFAEQVLRLYCKKTDEKSLKIAADCFRAWCKKRNMPVPKGGDVNNMELTPVKQDDQSTSNSDTSVIHNQSFSSRLSF